MRRVWCMVFGAVLMGVALHALQGCCVDCNRRIRALEDQLDSGVPDFGFDEAGLPIEQDGGASDRGPLTGTLPTYGGAVALPRDESFVLAVARYTGAGPGGGGASGLVKLNLNIGAAQQLTGPVAVGVQQDQAYQVVIGGPDDDIAYVSGSPNIQKIAGVRSDGPLLTMAMSAAEPRGIALAPGGNLLYVANWGEGTITVLNTADMSVNMTIDLNPALAASGMLGGNLAPRLALAHPWGIAINGQTIYVTEFFSQSRPNPPPGDAAFDLGRQGVVYKYDTMTRNIQLITLAPRVIADARFVDSNGATTGCFPNQLTSLTLHNHRLYVAAVCASPRGPVGPIRDPGSGEERNVANYKTLLHSAIFVINTDTNTEAPNESLLLTQAFLAQFERDGVPDDARRRMPLLVSEMAFVPRTDTAYVAAYGSDALYRIDFNPDGTVMRVGAPSAPFIDLNPDGMPSAAGSLPRGLAITNAGSSALVLNEHARNVALVSLASQRLVSAADVPGAHPSGNEADINNGRRSFVTGRGRWSYRGQAWSSCEACHPSGQSDGVTWFFRDGPRQTIPIGGSFSGDGTGQRLFNWSATADEVHDYELLAREVSGGVGGIVIRNSNPPANSDRIIFDDTPVLISGQVRTSSRNDGLNGSTQNLMPSALVPPLSVVDEWDDIFAYTQSVRAPRAPQLLRADVQRGRTLFALNHCDGCHAGDQWTISQRWYFAGAPNPTDPARVTTYRLDTFPGEANVPGALTPNPRLRTLDPLNESQMSCALRSVGTYPGALSETQIGVSPPGVKVREVRGDMSTPALGLLGYNAPSLLGLATSAPYLHAGNARTLEEVFTDTFAEHNGAFVFEGQFPGPGDRAVAIRQLVAFLLSLDDQAITLAVPPMLIGRRGMFSPLLCPQP